MPMLELRQLEVFYGDAQAVFGVDVRLDEGQAIAIIGANGAGKTTILRAIAGLTPARRGQILFDGADIARERADLIARRGVALVPEGRRLFATLTAEENLQIGPLSGRKGHWTLERVLDLFPAIREFRARRPSQISGGQQQMVAIGRALLANPRLLLCDEISLGLAPKVVGEIYACFERIRATGISIVIVEQDIRRARAASDWVYCLLKGRVSRQGKSADLSDEAISQAYFGS